MLTLRPQTKSRRRLAVSLRITRRNLGGNGVEALYTEHDCPATLALEVYVDPATEEAREVEAEGYHRKRPPKNGRKFCYSQRHPYDFDPVAINAIRCVVDDIRPSWVEEVRDATQLSADPRWIAAWCEMSPQVVVAIIENMRDRGELPSN